MFLTDLLSGCVKDSRIQVLSFYQGKEQNTLHLTVSLLAKRLLLLRLNKFKSRLNDDLMEIILLKLGR